LASEVVPAFDPPIEGLVFDRDGKLLLREHEALDGIAIEHGLTPFSDFGDNREVPADFDGDPDELQELLGESSPSAR
jgi:hypothetical protein